ILFLTAEGRGDSNISRGFAAGANDYVTKPFSKVELLARVRVNLEQSELRQQYKRLALLDPLTGLANRRQLYARLEQAMAESRRHGSPLAVIMADVDGFKAVNDAEGHETGDLVLLEFARRLQAGCRTEDLAARYGGDEFVVVLMQTGLAEAGAVAERLRQGWAGTLLTAGEQRLRCTASFGVACYGGGGWAGRPEALIGQVDRALYAAKGQGGNRVVCLDEPGEPT
ncbi:MAG: diguanylate cyclase, partial [Phycisphaerae bacterium]